MFGKLRTGHWLLILVVLGSIWWLTGRLSPSAKQRTFREMVMQLDTNSVRTFSVHPAPFKKYPTLVFSRSGEGWMLHMGQDSTLADDAPVHELLKSVSTMRVLRLAGERSVVGARHDLGDSTADMLSLDASGMRHELLVGSTAYGDGPETVVMQPGDKYAYAVAGRLGEIVDKTFGDWMPKYLVRGDPFAWKRLTFNFPGDSGYVMERHGDRWTINGQVTDSTRTWHYLESLARSKGLSVTDPRDTALAKPTFRLVVEDSTRAEPITVVVFALPDRFIVRSSLNPRSVMPFDGQHELPRMFRMPGAFMATPEER